ncbi:hypothetical protein Ahy_B06g085056 [Arachis hypogaea]|uniref:Replication protein A 70 kDa DNA-binding subunit B/D first OB fold domain-containing protein n=1 Tax=Arachis hypogaea TaxID=3818 RepID=A0A444YTD2_ARAHY|nr:hypothetical protein Ahy_B06g085056 [Arachis hypogaea]
MKQLAEDHKRRMLIERMQGERDKWLAAINTSFGHIEAMAARYDLIKCINAGPKYKGDTIQCSIKGIFVPIFEDLLVEGNVYVVNNFVVTLTTIKFKPTRHEFRINFKRGTIVRPVQDSSVPLNGFNFVPLKKIHAESKKDSYLVGVMGVSNINYNSKLFINVEFPAARNFFARVNKLDSVDEQGIMPLVCDQPVSIEKDFLRLSVYKTITEIKEHNQDAVFVTATTIKEVETEFGWWYKGCKKCRRGLRKLEKRYFCPNCVEDYGFYVPIVQGPANNLTEVVPQNQLPSHCGSHKSCLTERSSTIIGVQKRQSSSIVASVAINLVQLYEDVNLSTVKTHPPSGDTQSGQNVDPFVDDEVLNGYDDSMLDVDMEDNFIPSSETLHDM